MLRNSSSEHLLHSRHWPAFPAVNKSPVFCGEMCNIKEAQQINRIIQTIKIFIKMIKWDNMNESDHGGQEVAREKFFVK